MTAAAAFLPDHRRLHLQDGPIDLVIEAFGPAAEVGLAYDQACRAFAGLLAGLVAELPALRRAAGPASADQPGLSGPVARRMLAAVLPHAATFITPMAAVAGAVADHVLAAMAAGRRLDRAYVNNGGDIALHLAPGTAFDIGLVTRLPPASGAVPAIDGTVRIAADQPIRGVATSGAGGRSFSLGIANAVTVLAASAAAADAAATLIANAVDVDSPAIERCPATSLDPDSDLGERLVTVAVGPLTVHQIHAAVEAGRAKAEALRQAGLIEGALICLRGHAAAAGAARPATTLHLAQNLENPRKHPE